MNQVKDILLKQRAEFCEKLEPTQRECGDLQTQLNFKIEQLRALKMSIAQIDTAIAAIDAAEEKQSTNARPKIMDVVLDVLGRAPNGMTAREIMFEINTKHLLGAPIQRHSLSPQLSRLKDRDGKVELRGDKWFRLPEEPQLFGKVERRF